MATLDAFNLPDELYYQKRTTCGYEWKATWCGLVWMTLPGFRPDHHCTAHQATWATACRAAPLWHHGGGKYVGPLRLPVGGTVVEVNDEIMDNPGLLTAILTVRAGSCWWNRTTWLPTCPTWRMVTAYSPGWKAA